MKRIFIVGLAVAIFASQARAIDVGLSQVPIHKDSLATSLIYEHASLHDDFDTRGRATFKANVIGARCSYGLSDQLSLAVSGGSIVDPKVEAQGSTFRGGSGFIYGVDIYNEVFPATAYWPGIQLSLGASGFQTFFDRTVSAGTSATADQRMSGFDVHGNLLFAEKWGRFSPYLGLRAEARSIDWTNNELAIESPARIHGTARGNVSFIIGLPIQLTKQLRLELESILINQTALSAGFTWAAF